MKPQRAICIFTTAALIFALPSTGFAQSKDALAGTWKLISVTDTTDAGEVVTTLYGRNPDGLLTYTTDGRMMVIITDDGRKPLSILGRRTSSVEERAELFSSCVAYSGRYTFTGDKVIHHVEVASLPNFVNTDLVRVVVHIDRNRLTIRNPTAMRNDVHYREELTWERLK